MLDVFVAFWVLLGFWLLLIDRDRQWTGVPDTPPQRGTSRPVPGLRKELGAGSQARLSAAMLPRHPHSARWLAGGVLGLALATKWSGMLAVIAAVLFVVVSELAWRRRMVGRFWVQPGRMLASVGFTLVLLPTVVYLLSYVGWFANFEHTLPGKTSCPGQGCPTSLPGQVEHIGKSWVGEQAAIFRFHHGLSAEHPYRASATTWPLMLRPVAYYYEDCSPAKVDSGEGCVVAQGNVAEILGMGNPAIWWLALPAYLILGWLAVRRRDWVAWTILLLLLSQYVPWLISPRPVFFFYATPLVPFVCYAVAYAAVRLGSHHRLRWVPPAVAAIALAGFVFWYPLFAGLEIPKAAWDLRIWLRPGWV
jgi:dolichyl-phosphate-mannose-protein mannosyltransferase